MFNFQTYVVSTRLAFACPRIRRLINTRGPHHGADAPFLNERHLFAFNVKSLGTLGRSVSSTRRCGRSTTRPSRSASSKHSPRWEIFHAKWELSFGVGRRRSRPSPIRTLTLSFSASPEAQCRSAFGADSV